MEQGPVEDLVASQCARQRRPLPAKFAEAPELWPGLELFYQAFFDLTTCRTSGWDDGPIPWLAINTYASFHTEWTDEMKEDLFDYVRHMDQVYLGWCKRRQEKK